VRLRGQRALVTGASSGIGEACARAFAGEGCHLLLVARRRDRIDELARQCREVHGVDVLPAAIDVRDRTAVESWIDALESGWRDIDVLVNSAGLARGLAPLHEGNVEDWEEMIDTNLKGLLYVTRAVLRGMVERGKGHVINIGSIAGHESYAGGNVYCATKHAVTGLTRALAIDTLGSGVRVSSVDPGLVDTEFSEVRFHGDRGRARSVYQGLRPLGADDVAEAVMFCATRPPHANVREMVLLSAAQASSVHVHREPSGVGDDSRGQI
jgi:3-hydroxy acid dehydrogenase/malonic semialdehyde reductase